MGGGRCLLPLARLFTCGSQHLKSKAWIYAKMKRVEAIEHGRNCRQEPDSLGAHQDAQGAYATQAQVGCHRTPIAFIHQHGCPGGRQRQGQGRTLSRAKMRTQAVLSNALILPRRHDLHPRQRQQYRAGKAQRETISDFLGYGIGH